MMRRTFLTSALDMPEIMSYIYSKSWKLQFSASSSIIIIEDYYLQTFLHSLDNDGNTHIYAEDNTKTIEDYIKLYEDMHLNSQVYDDFNVAYLISEASS